MELAFGNRALAEEAGRDNALVAHVVGERQSDRKRQPAADDGVAAIEVGSSIE